MTRGNGKVSVVEAAIRERIHELADAVRTMDLDRLKAIYAPDMVWVDIPRRFGKVVSTLGGRYRCHSRGCRSVSDHAGPRLNEYP